MIFSKINIADDLIKAFEDFASIMIQSVPILIKAIVLFVIGYILARVVSSLLGKALKKLNFDALAVQIKLEEPLRIIGAKKGLSMFVSKIVFWLIMLVVIVSTTKNLGIEILTTQVERVIEFIPNVFTAVLILLVGYIIATKIKEVLINLTTSLGGVAGSLLGNIMYYFIMIMVVITAIEQMGVNTDLISRNILIIVAVILIAGAVAYGYAAREVMRNMLSSFYSRKNFHEGQRIKIGDLEGVILEIDNTSLVLKTGDSKVVLPSSELMSNRIEIIEEPDSEG
ncbi:MAG: hypothetical protein COA58_04405 [Bacteroidetes bacterium]|nr:MAG: hypothetical protein COA58_04405 [Bacteroidota bacterium]